MPVSHLGLTVSHIPSATSFYLSALQPMGYRYIGHQGDSIGLGVDSADFFLTQSPIGTRPSPNHIAFLADSRLVVRECYASALNSGGLPSGSPNYRNDDCSCFNAAVEDLDGNTIEFIFRQPHGEGDCCDGIAPPEDQRVLTWQKDVADSATQDDALSVAKSMVSRGSLASKTSRSKSRMQTALDLASTTSKSVKSETPSQGISRSSTAPAKSDFPGKTIIGTALGAAAGAALIYAMTKTESENAKAEAKHEAYMSSKPRSRSTVVEEKMPPPPRAETLPPSIPPAYSQAPKAETRKFHRNYSTTESAFSRRPPPQDTRAMRMIEANGNHRDDDDVQEFMSRYNGMRAEPTRSRTVDEIDYAPAPSRGARSQAPSGHSIKRASTLPIEEPTNYYLEAPPPKSSVSRHSSHRHDAVPRSTVSHSSRHSHRRSSRDDEDQLKRHDSGVSMHSSHRSRRERERERESDPSRSSSASTVKPYRPDRKHDTIPAAVAAAAIPHVAGSRAPSSCLFPAAISLPASSKAPSNAPTASFVSAQQAPLDHVASKQSWEDFEADADESDGMGDVKTVMPDDSISCVDLGEKRRRRKRRDSHGSSRRSEASTVKPAKRDGGKGYSVVMPVREKREGKRSVLGF